MTLPIVIVLWGKPLATHFAYPQGYTGKISRQLERSSDSEVAVRYGALRIFWTHKFATHLEPAKARIFTCSWARLRKHGLGCSGCPVHLAEDAPPCGAHASSVDPVTSTASSCDENTLAALYSTARRERVVW
jgi:hypothetical protein